ncbi:MAG: lamin tail domain-containing protein, partial [Candidatus Izemoplasmatales bacterium]|nr:lamin tail domain-containing protein [Candidatus Izemoplasmatales bacterium]
ADVYTTLVGDLIKVTGILTTDIKPAQYFFQDATAGIALDVYSMQTAFAAIPIGSEIVITGSVDMSNGLYEINVLDYEVLSTTPALPTPADINAVPFTNEALLAYQGQLVAFSGFVLKDNPKDVGYGTYEFVLMDVLTEEEIVVRLDNRSLGYLDAKTELLTLVPGDEVVITGAVLGWYKGYQLLISDADQFEKGTNGLTNAQKIQLDLAKMSETLRLSEDFVFVTGLYGTTFEVQNVYGFAANYVDYTTTVGTLAVTNPYAYDAYGLLVVIATNGSDELEVEFDLVVESLSISSLTDDLFFSEYGEGSSNNKWLEIYNGTGADVDLSNYSIQYYNNGATAVTQTLVLSGTLVAGDVLVLTTDAANQLIKDEADGIYAYPSVVHYNGDDAVALLNGTAIIDLIGVIGEDPGASWPVGTGATAEFTLVRKPAILAPNATFTADEWLVYPQDTFTYIGSHEVDTIELTNEIKVLSDKAKLAELEDVFYAETTISLPVLGDLGSQISWTIKTDEGTNAVLVGADLTLAQVADDTTAQVVMEATLTLGEGEEAATSTVLVTFILVGQTDADKLASAIADINTGIDDDCDGYEVVVLPTSGLFGTTITWALVSGEATLDGSTITFAQTSAVGTVVLDATFVTGTATETVRYTINVTPVEIITDFSLIPAMADTTPVFVQGVVAGLSYDGAFLQDANGVGFFMYGPGSKAELAIGDEVIYKGNIASYKDAKQLASGILLEELSAGNALIYNTVTADEIHAFAIGDAGSLFTFDGFVYKGVSGTTMTLGYTLADGITTGTVTIRYYSNWADLVLVANNYAIDDTIPAVNFILYNFRDGLKQLDVLNIPTLAPAIEALDDSVEAAITYEYVPVYEYHFETSVKTGNNIHNEYLQSALLAANPTDMYEGVMFDLARYLGALYRATGSTIVAIQYDGIEYFWNETIGLLGSNWVDDTDTTLVSVLVADFQAEVLTDSVVLALVDSEGFVYVLELTFNITMDLDEAIEATIENAILFEYVAPDAYTYYYETSVYADMTLTTVYLLENVSVDSHEIMWDMARFLGALYRVQDSNVASIVYKGQEYTWNELLGLHGSNWAYNDG